MAKARLKTRTSRSPGAPSGSSKSWRRYFRYDFIRDRSNLTLQHGANTDNSDLIAVGTEPEHCKSIEPANVSITNSTIIIDRDHSSDERARNYGPNALFNWRAPLGKLDIRGNKIVNLERWSYKGSNKNIIIPDQSSKNTMCKNRKACGI